MMIAAECIVIVCGMLVLVAGLMINRDYERLSFAKIAEWVRRLGQLKKRRK